MAWRDTRVMMYADQISDRPTNKSPGRSDPLAISPIGAIELAFPVPTRAIRVDIFFFGNLIEKFIFDL